MFIILTNCLSGLSACAQFGRYSTRHQNRRQAVRAMMLVSRCARVLVWYTFTVIIRVIYGTSLCCGLGPGRRTTPSSSS
jgi:hypothetical protein